MSHIFNFILKKFILINWNSCSLPLELKYNESTIFLDKRLVYFVVQMCINRLSILGVHVMYKTLI